MRLWSVIAGLAATLLMAGCYQAPVMASAMRVTGFAPDAHLGMVCITTERGDAEEAPRRVMELYRRGWRLAYASEYTNQVTHVAVMMCFEGPISD